jgi:hypothetical protein
MTIQPELSGPTLKESRKLRNLLSLINDRLAVLGRYTWEDCAFGIQNRDHHGDFEDLKAYRDILYWKLGGCDCFQGYTLPKIISKIKTLTNL